MDPDLNPNQRQDLSNLRPPKSPDTSPEDPVLISPKEKPTSKATPTEKSNSLNQNFSINLETIHLNPEHLPRKEEAIKEAAPKGKLRKLCSDLCDTEVMFAVGDLSVAAISSQYLGIAANAVASVAAVGGICYESLTNKKEKFALGFFSMSAVSAITVVSIALNSFSSLGTIVPPLGSQMFYDGLAFGLWTVANFFAGVNKRKESLQSTATKESKTKNSPVIGVSDFLSRLKNHQIWFCAGSLAAVHAKPFPMILISWGLVQSLRKDKTENPTINNWKDFHNAHATPSRLRAIAYAARTIEATVQFQPHAIPYFLWTVGNFGFDSQEKRIAMLRDLKSLIHRKRL